MSDVNSPTYASCRATPRLAHLLEGLGQRTVVCGQGERHTLQHVSELADCQVSCKQLTVKHAVPHLCGRERLREEGQRPPPALHKLLHHCPSSVVTGISAEVQRRPLLLEG